MNRYGWLSVFLLLVLAVGLTILWGEWKGAMDQAAWFELVDEHYTEPSGLLRTYGREPEELFLSETVGLYFMQALASGEEERFMRQVDVLEERWLVREAEGVFMPWKLKNGEKATVNALIDDLRIIRALEEGANVFQNAALRELADELLDTIMRVQVTQEGWLADFYDWTYGVTSERLILSYGQVAPTESYVALLGEAADLMSPFVPLAYDLNEDRFLPQREVHMVDQFLIMIDMERQGFDTGPFQEWLRKEWSNEGMISGRYLTSDVSGNGIESVSVYAMMGTYAELRGDHDLKRAADKKREALAFSFDSYEDVHFFDLYGFIGRNAY